MAPPLVTLLSRYWKKVQCSAPIAIKTLVSIVSLLVLFKHFHNRITQKIYIQEKHPIFTLLGPYDHMELKVKDVYNQLIDIKDFKFLINPKDCRDFTASFLLIVIIPSKPNYFDKRVTIRNTWGQGKDFAKTLFLLGQTNETAVMARVEEESKVYGDIVLGSFVDAYRNMTYKHLMGLKWVAHHCGSVRYVLKADDDVLVNSLQLWRFLVRELSPWGARGLLLCHLNPHMSVIRDSTEPGIGIWAVSKEEYEGDFYPPSCRGDFIIYSQDVVLLLLETTQQLPYFWIDDVQITGVAAAKAGLKATDMTYSIYLEKEIAQLIPLYSKNLKKMVIDEGLIYDMNFTWDDICKINEM